MILKTGAPEAAGKNIPRNGGQRAKLYKQFVQIV